VTPTFQDGWFLAWWPAPSDDSDDSDDNFRIIARDAGGEDIAELDYRRVRGVSLCSET
jgi:hypothetical protein